MLQDTTGRSWLALHRSALSDVSSARIQLSTRASQHSPPKGFVCRSDLSHVLYDVTGWCSIVVQNAAVSVLLPRHEGTQNHSFIAAASDIARWPSLFTTSNPAHTDVYILVFSTLESVTLPLVLAQAWDCSFCCPAPVFPVE